MSNYNNNRYQQPSSSNNNRHRQQNNSYRNSSRNYYSDRNNNYYEQNYEQKRKYNDNSYDYNRNNSTNNNYYKKRKNDNENLGDFFYVSKNHSNSKELVQKLILCDPIEELPFKKNHNVDNVVLDKEPNDNITTDNTSDNKTTTIDKNKYIIPEYISFYHQHNLSCKLAGDCLSKIISTKTMNNNLFSFLNLIPQIELEILRSKLLQQVRDKQKSLLIEKIEMNVVPKQSFNRWLLERKVLESKWIINNYSSFNSNRNDNNYYFDPLIPSLFSFIQSNDNNNGIDPRSESLKREILEDIPVKVSMFPRSSKDAKQSMEIYLNYCKDLNENDNIGNILSNEIKLFINNKCNEYNSWLIKELNSNRSDKEKENNIMDKLKECKDVIGKILQEKLNNVVEELCSELAVFSNQLVVTKVKDVQVNLTKLILDNNPDLLKMEHSQSSLFDYIENYFNEKTINNLIRNMTKTVDKSRVCFDINTSEVDLNLLGINDNNNSYSCYINSSHYEKLKKQFNLRLSLISSSNLQQLEQIFLKPKVNDICLFDYFLFCMLIRYSAMFGISERKFEGAGLHAACPVEVFEVLNENLEVQMESFASPLNCYFGQFCSAFGDIDFWFGSIGSFFECYPLKGSFEANPPFSEELMQFMVSHMEYLLDRSSSISIKTCESQPLTFVIVVPNWMDADSLQSLCKSPYLTKEIVLGAQDHCYINGFQHSEPSHKRSYSAVHETHIFFLQNKDANSTQPITNELIEKLKQAFKSRK
ncbi:hypothetical protein ABK040_000169 [Willaertia magna]